jgi:hypothetical protein
MQFGALCASGLFSAEAGTRAAAWLPQGPPGVSERPLGREVGL